MQLIIGFLDKKFYIFTIPHPLRLGMGRRAGPREMGSGNRGGWLWFLNRGKLTNGGASLDGIRGDALPGKEIKPFSRLPHPKHLILRWRRRICIRPHLSLAESCEISFYTFTHFHERRIWGELRRHAWSFTDTPVLSLLLSFSQSPATLALDMKETLVLLYSVLIGVAFSGSTEITIALFYLTRGLVVV